MFLGWSRSACWLEGWSERMAGGVLMLGVVFWCEISDK